MYTKTDYFHINFTCTGIGLAKLTSQNISIFIYFYKVGIATVVPNKTEKLSTICSLNPNT